MLSVEDSVHGIKYIWPLDDCGRLVNLGEVSELQIQYRPLCRYAADQLQHMLTDQAHAIYLRGSVSIGAAIPHYSDLDLFVVASGALEVSELSLEIQRRFSIVTDVDILVLPTDDIINGNLKRPISMLATQSKFIGGSDIREFLPSFFPDAEFASSQLPSLAAELERLTEIVNSGNNGHSFRGVARSQEFWIVWTLRVIIRASTLLSMLQTMKYSTHLGTCTQLNCESFPEHKSFFLECYNGERKPYEVGRAISRLIETFENDFLPLWRQRIGS